MHLKLLEFYPQIKSNARLYTKAQDEYQKEYDTLMSDHKNYENAYNNHDPMVKRYESKFLNQDEKVKLFGKDLEKKKQNLTEYKMNVIKFSF